MKIDPITRREQYLSYMAGLSDSYPENPITREEQYLYYLCKKGSESGPGTPGKDGREVELQKGESAIQWRYKGESDWKNLVQLSELKGAKGDKGAPGQGIPSGGTTGQTLVKKSETDYDTEWKTV